MTSARFLSVIDNGVEPPGCEDLSKNQLDHAAYSGVRQVRASVPTIGDASSAFGSCIDDRCPTVFNHLTGQPGMEKLGGEVAGERGDAQTIISNRLDTVASGIDPGFTILRGGGGTYALADLVQTKPSTAVDNSSRFVSAIDDGALAPREHNNAAGEAPRQAKVKPLDRSLLHKLFQSTMDEKRRAERRKSTDGQPQIEHDETSKAGQEVPATTVNAPPGFYIPVQQDLRNLHVKSKDRKTEMVRTAVQEQPSPKEVKDDRNDCRKGIQEIATPKLPQESSTSSHNRLGGTRKICIKGKHGEEEFVELPIPAPGLSSTATHRRSPDPEVKSSRDIQEQARGKETSKPTKGKENQQDANQQPKEKPKKHVKKGKPAEAMKPDVVLMPHRSRTTSVSMSGRPSAPDSGIGLMRNFEESRSCDSQRITSNHTLQLRVESVKSGDSSVKYSTSVSAGGWEENDTGCKNSFSSAQEEPQRCASSAAPFEDCWEEVDNGSRYFVHSADPSFQNRKQSQPSIRSASVGSRITIRSNLQQSAQPETGKGTAHHTGICSSPLRAVQEEQWETFRAPSEPSFQEVGDGCLHSQPERSSFHSGNSQAGLKPLVCGHSADDDATRMAASHLSLSLLQSMSRSLHSHQTRIKRDISAHTKASRRSHHSGETQIESPSNSPNVMFNSPSVEVSQAWAQPHEQSIETWPDYQEPLTDWATQSPAHVRRNATIVSIRHHHSEVRPEASIRSSRPSISPHNPPSLNSHCRSAAQDPISKPTIFAGHGWISPHPLSIVSSANNTRPQSKIFLPVSTSAALQIREENPTMSYAEWKEIQERGLRESTRRNFSMTESGETHDGVFVEERGRFWRDEAAAAADEKYGEQGAAEEEQQSSMISRGHRTGTGRISEDSSRRSMRSSKRSRLSSREGITGSRTLSERNWEAMEEGEGGWERNQRVKESVVVSDCEMLQREIDGRPSSNGW